MAAGPFQHGAFLRQQLRFLRPSSRPRQPQRRWRHSKPEIDATEKEIPIPNTVPTADIPFWMRLGPLTRSVQAYGRAQRRRPWITQICTSLTIYFCADLSAQHINGKEYDVERTGRSLIIGGISSIPSFEWCASLLVPPPPHPLALYNASPRGNPADSLRVPKGSCGYRETSITVRE